MKTQHEAGRSSELFDYILNGQKTIEVRLAKGKFLDFKVGDLVSLREDFYENGKVERSRPDQAITRIVALRRYNSLRELYEVEGIERTTPWLKSIDEAVSFVHTFYSEEDEVAYGALAIEFELVRGRADSYST